MRGLDEYFLKTGFHDLLPLATQLAEELSYD